ncbi:MAG TPA: glycosyltransferase family 4 protein [Humidesulfovibrio sp.]|uniref:glycosyltransferase family 4 protein n=1 Tax=Humidesulfovibrio sp. TaxID=2910988 RepID=UPI002C490AAF|nr:glycosyltransferase family 4 protein [Humidesulfovibrio sp.]HWR02681.1 glycosyltransferase family 4 protein [Humidesulfovibrio sp.]
MSRAALDLLFLTPSGETLPSVRFRVLPFVDLGRARGLAVDWRRAPKAIHQRLGFLLTLPRARVIVIQQKLFAPWELSLIRRRCQTLVYDVDDALWALHPAEIGQPGSAEKAAKIKARFAHACANVDLVIAGNDYLAGHARETQANIFVLPTLLDTAKYTPAPPDAHGIGPFRVGWMGTSGNLFFLPEVLRQLSPHRERLDIRIVSDHAYEGELHEMVSFERWSPSLEVDQLRGFEVGLMPLTDDEYTRGKCGFKILQYMACGAVPVASAVGFNNEILTHGQDGLLVRQPSDWAAHILALAGDRDLLERMAQAARATVVQRFSLERMAPELWRALGL